MTIKIPYYVNFSKNNEKFLTTFKILSEQS
jgi:hypothetical protein